MEVIGLADLVDEPLKNFMDYVTSTYVDEMTATFPKELWTQVDTFNCETRIIRTNNHVESFHGRIKKDS